MNSLDRGELLQAAAENRRALWVLLICAVIFIVSVVVASQQIARSEQTYRIAKASVSRASAEAERHVDDVLYLHTSKDQFFAALAERKIGQGEEIQWGEVLLDVSDRVGVRGFTYRMNDPEPLDQVYGVEPKAASVHRTEVNLAFEARHGPEVFHFFDSLKQGAPGAYAVQQLILRRVASVTDTPATQRVALVPGNGFDADASSGALEAYDSVGVTATLYWYQFLPNRDAPQLPNT